MTAGNKEKFNMMTASWGCIGWLWNKPVAVAFIRPERFTHEFIEKEDRLTLCFLGESEEMRKAYALCGAKSGRDCDKVAATGLHPVEHDDIRGGAPDARMPQALQGHDQGERVP